MQHFWLYEIDETMYLEVQKKAYFRPLSHLWKKLEVFNFWATLIK